MQRFLFRMLFLSLTRHSLDLILSSTINSLLRGKDITPSLLFVCSQISVPIVQHTIPCSIQTEFTGGGEWTIDYGTAHFVFMKVSK